MLQDLLRVAMPLAVLGVLTIIGYVAMVCLGPRRFAFLTPALPAVGVLVTVVGLHWTTLIVGTDIAIWAVLALVAAVLALVAVRSPSRLVVPRAELRSLAVALALGIPTLVIAAQPSFRVDDATIVHPNHNHDSFFYVSSSAWLQQRPATDRPDLGPTPRTSVDVPADQPAIATHIFGFRLGEPLVQASIGSVSGRPIVSYWYDVTAGWLMLMPGAAMVLAASLRIRRWIGGVAGSVASISSLAIFQVHNQNGPSVLAVATLPLVIGLVYRAGSGGDDTRRTDVFVASVGVAAFVGLYSELSTLVGLALLAGMLTAGRPWRRTLARTLALGAGVAIVSPFAVFNSVRLLRTLSDVTGDFPRKAFTGPVSVALSHATGTTGINEPAPRTAVALALGALVVVGLCCAIAIPRLRVLTVALTLSAAAVVTIQYRARNDYSLERFVMVSQPIITMIAFAGLLVAAAAVFAAVRRRAVRVVVVAATCVAVVGSSWVQVATQLRTTATAEELRAVSVRPEVLQAIGWVRDHGGPEGVDATVLTDDYVDRLWLADGLRGEKEVSYPYLTGDYFGVSSFTEDSLTRYLITSRNVFTDAPDSAIIRSNDRYVMYDLQGVIAWFALPVDGFYGMEAGGGGTGANWSDQDSQLVTMRTSPTAQISLNTAPNTFVGESQIEVSLDGSPLGEFTVAATPGAMSLHLAPSPLVATVQLHARQPARQLSNEDPRLGVYNLSGDLAG